MTVTSHKFRGRSGHWYHFEMSDLPAYTKPSCGVYIFGRKRFDGNFDVLYIGKAKTLSGRLTESHEKFGIAQSQGMTTLGQLPCNSEVAALAIERDLIVAFQPPLNDNLK